MNIFGSLDDPLWQRRRSPLDIARQRQTSCWVRLLELRNRILVAVKIYYLLGLFTFCPAIVSASSSRMAAVVYGSSLTSWYAPAHANYQQQTINDQAQP